MNQPLSTTRWPRWAVRAGGLSAAVVLVAWLAGCQNPKPATRPAGETRPAVTLHYSISTARRQANFVRIDLPFGTRYSRLELGRPSGPGDWSLRFVSALAMQASAGTVAGPAIDQLLGVPQATMDGGSFLTPIAGTDTEDKRTFPLPGGGGAVFLRLETPPTQDAGTYRFPITLAGAGGTQEASLEVSVSDLTLPAEPRVLAVATATTAQLTTAYPESFGQMQATYLDRNDPACAAAIAQLDALVRTAQRHGVSFFVEDVSPDVRIDEVGRVLVEWDAYDRTVGPYMDGTAFTDRTGLPVWLAPAPPRRIRDTPAQLRQYLAACAEHYRDRGWTATPAFLHASLIEPDTDADLRKQLLEVIEKNLDKAFALVGTPDLKTDFKTGLKTLWTVDDADTRLPPVAELATAESLRVWPWMCAARGLKGFVWRDAVKPVEHTPGHQGPLDMPLFVAVRPLPAAATSKNKEETPVAQEPNISLRLAWLVAGLNDTAHFGLLERRSDPTVAAEVLAGIAGRTGLGTAGSGPLELPASPGGYVYAGWPGDATTWGTLPAMLDRLTLANDPGKRVEVRQDDPLVLAARMWLAQAHRPVARVTGYRFATAAGRDGTVLEALAELQVENPIGTAARMTLKWPELPGSFEVKDNAPLDLEPYGVKRTALRIQGYLDSLREAPRPSALELTERNGGARLEFAALLPIYRMRATNDPPKIDGKGADWPNDAYIQTFGPMRADLRYLSRTALLAGKLPLAENPATMRWAYDNEFLYALIRCPETQVSDERNSEWPLDHGRWWGTDAVQVQIAGGSRLDPGTRIVQLAIKPAGTVLTRAATRPRDPTATAPGAGGLKWLDGPSGVRYAITTDKKGYTIELAIPRKWFPADHDADPSVPVWRVNVLRHRAEDLLSTSWSGPVVDDADVAMMGLLIGGE